jgi:hypothetical protein
MAEGCSPSRWTLKNAGMSFEHTLSVKNRALARRTGSCGKSTVDPPPGGVMRSFMNSAMTSDSKSLIDSGEGFSGLGTLGPPYAIAGT